MVLFKRKPVQFLQPPVIEDENQEVWHIPQTGEILTTYEEYLYRLDFYRQRRFICQISGHSGLTFFEALRSELAGAAEVDLAFPEALKGPILRKVQFQTVSRIDSLVDKIYEEFKNDYYPGEAVTVQIGTGDRLHGVVRDKARFGSKVLPDGTLTPPYSRYFVSLDDQSEEAIVDDSHIFRDRKVFTKLVLRSFIKKTVARASWNGAPWLVKDDVAEQYSIDTRIPPHLRYDNKLLERKQLQAQKRQSQADTNSSASPHGNTSTNGASNPFNGTGPVRLPELKPAPKNHKSQKHLAQQQQQGHEQQRRSSGTVAKGKQNVFAKPEPGQFVHLPLPGNPFQFPISFRDQAPSPVYTQPEPPPPPPPPKYPIEDLQLEPRGRVRPRLKFLCSDPPAGARDSAPSGSNVLMKSVGPLLETWDTLNVYCEIFKLDSFTFDDFVESMVITSDEIQSQLFQEIHCAVLKILVSSEAEGGKVQIQLPELEDDEDEEEEEEEEEAEASPTPEPQPQPTGRATRSSLAKLEAERLAAEAAAAEKELQEAEDAPKHLAHEVLAGFDWIEQLRKRSFKDGGWELIMVGLLHQLSKNERHKTGCDELLRQLVPKDVEPSRETVQQHYARLDVNHRVQALQIICMLTSETKAIRGYMEDCSEQMTSYRKEKIEWQRKRKQAIEELKLLNDQRKILLPDNLPPSPPRELAKTNGDTKNSDVDDAPQEGSDEVAETDDDVRSGRTLRRGQDRAAERKRKIEKEQERKEKAEAAAKLPKQSKQFLKVLKDIQKKEDEIKKCEDEIAVIDNDLREADCPRTRVLGKDRFWNRYYWFERNGMPYAGLPDSSTAWAGYANGCIWVQGPDKMEREGYIEMTPDLQDEYKAKFDMTVPQRKELEEGPTHIYDAHQWAYISEPDDVDALIDWLDPRGFNELKLRKEIVSFREKIAKHMENRKAYLEPDASTTSPRSDDKKEETTVATKRMSTRGRSTAATPEPPTPSYRSLNWQNTVALEELGHLHIEQPPPARSRKQTKKKEAAAGAEVAVATSATTRSKKSRT